MDAQVKPEHDNCGCGGRRCSWLSETESQSFPAATPLPFGQVAAFPRFTARSDCAMRPASIAAFGVSSRSSECRSLRSGRGGKPTL